MRKAAWLLAAVVTSCVLPKFDVDPALDEQVAGSGATNAGGSDSGSHAGSGGTSNKSGSANGGSTGDDGLGGEGGASDPISVGVPVGGKGSCSEPYPTKCGEYCRNLSNDFGACGDCAVRCPQTSECIDSKCICKDNRIACDNQCVPQSEDRCGSCLNHCKGAESCTAGECVLCPTGCAELKTAIAEPGAGGAYYLLDLGGQKDLRNTTIWVKFYANIDSNGRLNFILKDAQGGLNPFSISADPEDYIRSAAITVPNSPLHSNVTHIGFRVSAVGTPTAASQVFIDSISIDGDPIGPWDFTDAAGAAALGYQAANSDADGTVEWVKN